MSKFTQKLFFILRYRLFGGLICRIRNCFFRFLGMKIGKNTLLPKAQINWPNKVKIGDSCSIEKYVSFKYDGIWTKGIDIEIGNNVFIGANCEFNIRKGIKIGNDTLIASGCKFIDHDHGIELGDLMRIQSGPEKEIAIANNVWLGCNVIVLKGIEVGEGAIVAAGAVVTKSIPENEIWGGVPAKKIGKR